MNTGAAFYHQRTGYRNGMQIAAPPIPREDTPADERRSDASALVLSTAELAECTCPEWCERDHDRD
jgi:hypothetical protein